MTITYAEQPVRLLRDTTLFSAARGAPLLDGDLLVSNGGVTQLDADGLTIALGPASRVVVRQRGELVLLEGWLKVQARAAGALHIVAGPLVVDGAGATAILRVGSGGAEVFAEAGELTLAEGGAARRVRLSGEQFALRAGKQPLRVVGRAPASFVDAMPAGFQDQLVALAPAPAAAPRRERGATWPEVAPWLAGQPALRRQVAHRFHPPAAARTTRPRTPTVQH